MQSNDKTQFRVRLRHLANKFVLKGKNWDLHLESSRQDLKVGEIQTLQHFEDKSIEWTLSMEEIVRKAAWILHKSVYTIPGLIVQESKHVLHTKSREQCFFTF